MIGRAKYATFKSPGLANQFLGQVLHWRLGILILLVITIITFEYHSYRFIQKHNLWNINNLHLIFLNFLIFPILVMVIYGLLETRLQLSQAVHRYNLQRELSLKLTTVKDWDEIAATLFQFITSRLPLIGISLLVYNPNSDKYEIVIERFSSRETESSVRCLPLIHGGKQIALLYLYTFLNIPNSQAQIDLIESLAPVVALAVEDIHLLLSLNEKTQAIQKKEQDRIGRHLHDTLGHDLAYLRLKLDRLSSSGQLNGLVAFHQEIEQAYSVANHACEQMRSLLRELQEECRAVSDTDLVSHIKECALLIGTRANFQVNLNIEGKPEILPPEMQRQILYIVREILRNVDKHANAKNVTMALKWITNGLIIDFSDDGLGFCVPVRQKNDGHYGLKIVQEIVDELQGSISIVSDQNEGTRITIRLAFNLISI